MRRALNTLRATNDTVNSSAENCHATEIREAQEDREAAETLIAVANSKDFADDEQLEPGINLIQSDFRRNGDILHSTSSDTTSTKRDCTSFNSNPPLHRPRSKSSSNSYATCSAPLQDLELFDPIFLGAVASGLVGAALYVTQIRKAKRGDIGRSNVGSRTTEQANGERLLGFHENNGANPGSLTTLELSDDNAIERVSFDAAPATAGNVTPSVSSKSREISGEFKRQLRNMMSDLRRFSTVDLHGRNLGDDGTSYVSEALAFNDAVLCLDMSANGISERGVIAMCEALQNNACLEMLSLSSNNLQDAGTVALATYLETNPSINTLNLNSCGIGDAGAVALAKMLKKNTTLTALELNNNSIDYEGTCAIAMALAENSTLEMLSMSGNYVGGLGASALANGMISNEGIKGLMLNGNDIGNIGIESLCRALSSRKTKLSNLDIGNNGIGHEAGPYLAAYIKDDGELSSLNLYMNELCDLGAIEICNALKHNAGIEILDIGGNNILAAGAEALAEALMENETLRTLELGYNPIGPKGGALLANAVKFHSKISTLRMGWCKITKEGAWHIADAIKYNQCVTTLDLRGNELGDEGCAALAHSLSLVNENLTSLDLGYNEIKDKGAFALAQAIKNNADGCIASISVNNNYITKFGEVALTEAVELVQELNPDRDLYVQF